MTLLISGRYEERGLSIADEVFVENQSMYNFVATRCGEERTHFAPPGVDTEAFYPKREARQGRNDSYILSVGRFADPRKNVSLLFKAYAKLQEEVRDPPRLVLAGRTSPPREAWETARTLGIFDQVTFHEDVEHEKLAKLYRHATVFALSSDEEGLGLVLLEAMASGVPVVSTDCGGPSTIVVDARTGFLTPVGDVEALTSRLEWLLRHPSERSKMGSEARRRVMEHFSDRAAASRFLDVYRDLVAASPSAGRSDGVGGARDDTSQDGRRT